MTSRRAMGSHQSAAAISTVWLTPPAILQALGSFDLDPCACSEPRPWPTATRHLTAEDDGLSQPWAGRVWLNPPYGAASVKWMRRMVDHGQGVALIFARTETEWFFETVWRAPTASAVLFLEGRLTFHRPDGSPGEHNGGAPSVLIAYGAGDAAVLEWCGLPGRFLRLT